MEIALEAELFFVLISVHILDRLDDQNDQKTKAWRKDSISRRIVFWTSTAAFVSSWALAALMISQ